MMDIVTVAVIILDVIAIKDVLRRLRGEVPRFLWILCILFLPVAGAGFWYYVQYSAPEHKRMEREKRKRLKDRRD